MTKRELIDFLEADDSPDETEVTLKTERFTPELPIQDWITGPSDETGQTTITLYSY